MPRSDQKYADETVESLIRAFRKKGKSLDPDLAALHKALKRHYLDTKLTSKQAQARASWDVEQTRRGMTHTG
jgi:hypothetical protein